MCGCSAIPHTFPGRKAVTYVLYYGGRFDTKDTKFRNRETMLLIGALGYIEIQRHLFNKWTWLLQIGAKAMIA